MKNLAKILLALSLMIAMATFTSCTIVQQYFTDNTPAGSEGGENGGTENGGTENGTETEEEKATLTEKEWLDAMKSLNFSVDVLLCGPDADNVYKEEMFAAGKYTADARHMTSPFLENGEAYYTEIDGQLYEISKTEKGYMATQSTDSQVVTLGEAILDREGIREVFYLLKYDAASDSFKGEKTTEEGDTSTYEFKFENGKIVSATVSLPTFGEKVRQVTSVYNVGTTTVTLPEYWIKAPYEEWLDIFKEYNYTLDMQIFSTQMTTKMTLTSGQSTTTQGEEVVENFAAIIDGITYDIEKVDGVYVATQQEEAFAPQSVYDVLFSNMLYDVSQLYENLDYDKEADLYVAQYTNPYGNITTLKYKLKDGKLTEMSYLLADSEGAIAQKVEVTNIGTTVVELPEFTFAE